MRFIQWARWLISTAPHPPSENPPAGREPAPRPLDRPTVPVVSRPGTGQGSRPDAAPLPSPPPLSPAEEAPRRLAELRARVKEREEDLLGQARQRGRPKACIGLLAMEDQAAARHSSALGEYVEAVLEAGGVPRFLYPEAGLSIAEQLERVDAILIPGGADVDPSFYGGSRWFPNARIGDVSFDRFERDLIKRAYEREVPMLGICRGQQIMNVAAGGTLIQDIESEHPHSTDGVKIFHGQGSRLERKAPAHLIDVEPGSRLAAVMHELLLMVNSLHHQAVGSVAPIFAVTARARDGIIEAIERKGMPSQLGVQFHPEEMRRTFPEFGRLFTRLVEDAAAWRQAHPWPKGQNPLDAQGAVRSFFSGTPTPASASSKGNGAPAVKKMWKTNPVPGSTGGDSVPMDTLAMTIVGVCLGGPLLLLGLFVGYQVWSPVAHRLSEALRQPPEVSAERRENRPVQPLSRWNGNNWSQATSPPAATPVERLNSLADEQKGGGVRLFGRNSDPTRFGVRVSDPDLPRRMAESKELKEIRYYLAGTPFNDPELYAMSMSIPHGPLVVFKLSSVEELERLEPALSAMTSAERKEMVQAAAALSHSGKLFVREGEKLYRYSPSELLSLLLLRSGETPDNRKAIVTYLNRHVPPYRYAAPVSGREEATGKLDRTMESYVHSVKELIQMAQETAAGRVPSR